MAVCGRFLCRYIRSEGGHHLWDASSYGVYYGDDPSPKPACSVGRACPDLRLSPTSVICGPPSGDIGGHGICHGSPQSYHGLPHWRDTADRFVPNLSQLLHKLLAMTNMLVKCCFGVFCQSINELVLLYHLIAQ